MKICIIPDVHGEEHWKKIKSHINNYDKIIFLGDYADHFTMGTNRQLSNFNQIIKFKIANKDKVCLCWGNHDTSYYLGEKCSGYQYAREFDWIEMYKKYNQLFEVVYIFDKWIFSHAGVSGEWLRLTGLKDPKDINQLFKERAGYFYWVGPDSYGNNPTEGPLWIRPEALCYTALKGYSQMVGHTAVENAPKKVFENTETGDQIVLTDSRKYNCIIELDTETNKYEKLI